MSDETSDLDEVLGFLAEEGRNRRDPEEHPSPETLTAYQANELSLEEDERVQSHLGVCRHCTEMLLELEEFLRPPEVEAAPVADFEAAADWRRQASMVDPVGLRRALRATRAAAAILGALAIGLALYAGHLRGRLLTVRGMPETTLDLSITRGGGETLQTVRLPQALKFFVVSDHPSYRIEIVGKDGRRWVSQVIGRSELANTFPLVEGSLAPGEYQVRLYGLRPGKPEEAVGKPLRLLVLP